MNAPRRALDRGGRAGHGCRDVAARYASDGMRPAPVAAALFTLLLFAAENSQIRLPSSTTVSPGFMMIMASIAAFDGRGVVLGAAIVGFCGTAQITLLRRRRFATQLFNSCQYLLAATFTAFVFHALSWRSGPGLFAAAILATTGFAVVNVALVLPHVAIGERLPPGDVWGDMRPAIPNYFAFGLLGQLVGQLYSSVGWIAAPAAHRARGHRPAGVLVLPRAEGGARGDDQGLPPGHRGQGPLYRRSHRAGGPVQRSTSASEMGFSPGPPRAPASRRPHARHREAGRPQAAC